MPTRTGGLAIGDVVYDQGSRMGKILTDQEGERQLGCTKLEMA